MSLPVGSSTRQFRRSSTNGMTRVTLADIGSAGSSSVGQFIGGPVATFRVEHEAVEVSVFPATPTQIDTPDRGSRPVVEPGEDFSIALNGRHPMRGPTGALSKSHGGSKFEASLSRSSSSELIRSVRFVVTF